MAASFFSTGFDAAKIDPSQPSTPIPEGVYRVMVKNAEEKPTKTPGGLGLNVMYAVLDGEYKGRQIFHWLNLKNQNATSQEIGQRELSSLCHATGVMRPRSASEFVNRIITVRVAVEKDNRDQMRNNVKEIVLEPAIAQSATAGTVAQQAKQTVQVAQVNADPADAASEDEAAPWG